MKALVLSIVLLSYSFLSQAQKDTLAGWTFPNGKLSDTIADFSSLNNSNSFIKSVGTDPLQMKNGATTSAAQATGWDNGNGVKFWEATINTLGYNNLSLYSKQTAGGNNPGPRDFAVFYSIGDTEKWSKVLNSEVNVQNDWTSGVLSDLMLPADCENAETLHIKWIMTSDTAADGSIVNATGTSKIDDVFILGDKISSIENENPKISVYPNPASDFIMFDGIKSVSIYNAFGQLINSYEFGMKTNRIHIKVLNKGMYILKLQTFEGEEFVQKLLKNN